MARRVSITPQTVLIDRASMKATAPFFQFLQAVNDATVDGARLVLPSHTAASLPSAAVPGQVIFVPDETGGAVLAFSDGTNWRRVTDRNIVS